MVKKNALITLGLLIGAPLHAQMKMTVNNMSAPITVTYRFDTLNPIELHVGGYATNTLDVPAGVHVVSAEVRQPSTDKSYIFSLVDNKAYDLSLNSDIVIFSEDRNLFHPTKPFSMTSEEQIKEDAARREHLKHLPRHIYDRVVSFFHGLRAR